MTPTIDNIARGIEEMLRLLPWHTPRRPIENTVTVEICTLDMLHASDRAQLAKDLNERLKPITDLASRSTLDFRQDPDGILTITATGLTKRDWIDEQIVRVEKELAELTVSPSAIDQAVKLTADLEALRTWRKYIEP